MEKVAAYYRSTKASSESSGSIRDTAIKFNINRNKVRKILITMGEIKSPITEMALSLRRRGLSIKEISRELGVSAATVSTALPYEKKVDNTLEPAAHTSDVRKYRAYQKDQLERQVGKAGRNQDLSKARRGDIMAEQKIVEKEWQKDIKMSYTETYHRPHRFTWEEIDDMRKVLEKDLAEDSPTELRELLDDIASMRGRDDEEEKELEQLLAKKKLSKEEETRKKLLLLMTGQFPGALNDRNRGVLERIAGGPMPPEPSEVIRLHMELYDEYSDTTIDDEDAEVLRIYGKVEHGRTISRDVIVPRDIPLYALHYVIQRAFGWQNSHLRQFELPDERFKAITDGSAGMWSRLVGILFRSPLMDEDEEFWADDYNGGSFKNWLRKKYTGPYLSQCHGEGLMSCREDMEKLDLGADYYVVYCKSYDRKTGKYDGEDYVSDIQPVLDYYGNKRPEPKPWHDKEVSYHVEVVKFEQIPSEALHFDFERNPMALLERLPIDCVLAVGKIELLENSSEPEREYIERQITGSGQALYQELKDQIELIISKKIDAPEMQVLPSPVTDVLLYNYDFGDNWHIRITASENCPDLVESGKITQSELDRANVKCREVYRPVLIARDGEMLVDDVGGIHGFTDFLRKVNPVLKGLDPEDKEDARREKREYLEWARSLGWHRDKSSDFNLL